MFNRDRQSSVILARIFFVFFLNLLFPAVSSSTDCAANMCSWPEVLAQFNVQSAAVGSTCRVWMENYSAENYRLWKRCGVNATSSGAKLIDVYLGGLFTGVRPLESITAWTRYFVDGSGTLLTTVGSGSPAAPTSWSMPSNKAGSVAATTWTFGTIALGFTNTLTFSCVGSVLSGTPNFSLGTAGYFASRDGAYLRDTSAANNTISATCRTADTLLFDFGSVAPSCTVSVEITALIRGRETTMGSCDCIPRGQGFTGYTSGSSCSFGSIIGDPAGAGLSTAVPGSNVTEQGHTFTNDDLNRLGGTVPSIGSSATGGAADGYPLPGAQGTLSIPPGTNGSGPGGSGTGSGSGSGTTPGTGSGNCPAGVVNCNGDGSTDTGSVPSVPTYDSTISGGATDASPTWTDRILSFISTAPAVTAITGSSLSASGSCSISGTVMGATVDLGFCSLPSSFFSVMSAALIAVSHLVALFIIFRR
jgi:hypothetical protein